MDYQKLYDSLVVIRDLCREMQNCGKGCIGCPLTGFEGAVCHVMDAPPSNWKVKEVPKEIKLME